MSLASIAVWVTGGVSGEYGLHCRVGDGRVSGESGRHWCVGDGRSKRWVWSSLLYG